MKNAKPMRELKRIRKLQGLTQKELADKLGIKWEALSTYERGVRQPNYDILVRMAKELNAPLYLLLSDVICPIIDESAQ